MIPQSSQLHVLVGCIIQPAFTQIKVTRNRRIPDITLGILATAVKEGNTCMEELSLPAERQLPSTGVGNTLKE